VKNKIGHRSPKRDSTALAGVGIAAIGIVGFDRPRRVLTEHPHGESLCLEQVTDTTGYGNR
jgi:hypothetical protein